MFVSDFPVMFSLSRFSISCAGSNKLLEGGAKFWSISHGSGCLWSRFLLIHRYICNEWEKFLKVEWFWSLFKVFLVVPVSLKCHTWITRFPLSVEFACSCQWCVSRSSRLQNYSWVFLISHYLSPFGIDCIYLGLPLLSQKGAMLLAAFSPTYLCL